MDGCRVHKIARHSDNERYPEYLVAKPITNPTVAVMESHSVLLVRLPTATFIWQVGCCVSHPCSIKPSCFTQAHNPIQCFVIVTCSAAALSACNTL